MHIPEIRRQNAFSPFAVELQAVEILTELLFYHLQRRDVRRGRAIRVRHGLFDFAVEGIESIQRILDIVSFDVFDCSLCTIAQFVPRLLRLGRRDGESNVLYAIVYAGERIGGDNAAHVTVCSDKRLEISLTFFHQFQASVREIGVFKRNHL